MPSCLMSPTRVRSIDSAGRRRSLWWPSHLAHVCVACWAVHRLRLAGCRSSWHSRAVPRSTPVLWLIPSTLPLSIATAISLRATKAFVPGVCAPIQALGQHWNAPRSSPRLLPFNERRLKRRSENYLRLDDASDVPICRTEAVLKNFFKILG